MHLYPSGFDVHPNMPNFLSEDAFSSKSRKFCASQIGDYAISGCGFFKRAENNLKVEIQDANRIFECIIKLMVLGSKMQIFQAWCNIR